MKSKTQHMLNAETMTTARSIVRMIKNEGIDQVFCVPGESYLPVMDAIYDEEDIELISARHEGGASFMAEGWAKASGRPGVVLATRGVGGSNLAIGVHTAFQDSTPLVVFLGQVDSRFRGREGFQEVDLEQFFRPIAKWTVEITDPERVPELVGRAFRVAQSGRPGPVVVSLPENILKAEIQLPIVQRTARPRPAPSAREVEQVGRMLADARKPLIIAGGGVIRADAEDALIRFAEKQRIPVMAAFRRHDVFPNDHELYAGHLGLGTPAVILQGVKKADLIIAVGTKLSEVTTQDYSLISPEQQLIHVDISAETLGKVYPPDLGIVADAGEALHAFLELEVTSDYRDWARRLRAGFEQVSALPSSPPQGTLTNEGVIELLQTYLPPDAILTNDAGNFAGWLHRFYQFKRKKTYIGPTSGAMGYGLPAAIGAKLAHPNRTVVSLSGDGGFMMTAQELETAVRYHIPVISLVFNNGMYGTIRMHQELHYPKRVIGTSLNMIHFAELAKALGAKGFTVTTPEEFEQSLQEGLASNQPSVIDIRTDPDQIAVNLTIADIRQKAAL
ncbi:thiamine pyrophosphate TPP-binding domain-containing protein [Caldalkalibacillus thermarum TA2.A1]|uniref:Thiamine pyrophosphate TPP-binding domain-containing protein n=2 Tax=Caldalkalibacillus thermarum (strain TA2.A1) TaxID=986075 RepID=F5L4D1_CALTT|nr:thiamine pyrophosphate TPP-binding domain-containing protein [Caldalkalibacillus thermarum TA2.A1]